MIHVGWVPKKYNTLQVPIEIEFDYGNVFDVNKYFYKKLYTAL